VVYGDSRASAIARLERALVEYEVSGIRTNIPFFRSVAAHPDFVAGRLDTGFIDRFLAGGFPPREKPEPGAELVAMLVAALESRREAASAATPVPATNAWKIGGRESSLNSWPVKR
jgi:acetyl/propionyl-CoA carboxylase alpha subunit